jgi:hypothetical protein
VKRPKQEPIAIPTSVLKLRAANSRAAEKLEQDTLAYYASRTVEQAAEDEALSQASLRAVRKRNGGSPSRMC